jgi:hypothetical protein
VVAEARPARLPRATGLDFGLWRIAPASLSVGAVQTWEGAGARLVIREGEGVGTARRGRPRPRPRLLAVGCGVGEGRAIGNAHVDRSAGAVRRLSGWEAA